jgi:hypothetical protein
MRKSVIRVLAVLISVLGFLGQAPAASPQGHWEFGFHYSRWSIDLVRSVVEEGIGNALETELRDKILEDIQADYPMLAETSYSQELRLDSGGDNFGFEVRYYPGGEKGSFSLGFSVEKTAMRVSLPEVSASLTLEDQFTHQNAHFSASSVGEFLVKPWSFHLSFRWDIFPSSIVHPYLTFGLGGSTASALEQARVTYSFSGNLDVPGQAPENYGDSVSKSIKQLKEEMEAEGEEFFLPGFLPFLQLNIGLKAVITPNIHLLVDAGIWDGFLIRGGISIRL